MKLGQLGIVQLYLKLLQNGNVEEQNLGASGLWILAFADENKTLIPKVHGCIEGM